MRTRIYILLLLLLMGCGSSTSTPMQTHDAVSNQWGSIEVTLQHNADGAELRFVYTAAPGVFVPLYFQADIELMDAASRPMLNGGGACYMPTPLDEGMVESVLPVSPWFAQVRIAYWIIKPATNY